MKHLRILVTIFLSLSPLVLHAQGADQRISELLGSGDCFGLEREYVQMKDSVRSDVLRLMSETMLSAYFNRPEELRDRLSDLIDNHSEEIGAEFVRDTIDLHRADHSGGTRTRRALIRNMPIGGAEVNNILAYVPRRQSLFRHRGARSPAPIQQGTINLKDMILTVR